MHRHANYLKSLILFTFAITSLLFAQSNSVKSITDKALTDYQSQNYSAAISNMERALDIMKNKQENEYAKLLPQTLPGWTRGEISSTALDPRGIEKGKLIEQTYNKGNGYIKATLIINSPMVNDVKKMLNNPQGLANREGFSYETIANKKALIRYYENQSKGEITILANSNTIAAVYGNKVSLRDMMNYARLFKFSKISKVK